MTTTEERLVAYLAAPENFKFLRADNVDHDDNRPTYLGVRKAISCADGTSVSVQHSATHYCTLIPFTVEVWRCKHSPILGPYGDGEDPYPCVPLPVVAQYIDEHGGFA